jgi:hypothetical protein
MAIAPLARQANSKQRAVLSIAQPVQPTQALQQEALQLPHAGAMKDFLAQMAACATQL